jgi:hypothetical protein
VEQQPIHSIVGIATKYGLIQGVLLFTTFLLAPLTGIGPKWMTVVVNTILTGVPIVLAHWEFKRTHAGQMTYRQGLGSGTLLSSVAAVMMCVLAYLYVKYINTGLLTVAMEAYRTALEQRGITGEQAHKTMATVGAMSTPFVFAVYSLLTTVTYGFIVTLIVSIFTQKDPRAV